MYLIRKRHKRSTYEVEAKHKRSTNEVEAKHKRSISNVCPLSWNHVRRGRRQQMLFQQHLHSANH